jgi:hypothetical protein
MRLFGSALLLSLALLPQGLLGASQAPQSSQPGVVRELERERRMEWMLEERSRLEMELATLRAAGSPPDSLRPRMERQISLTYGILGEVRAQLNDIDGNRDRSRIELEALRAEYAERRARLDLRRRSIYKLGPLGGVQILLGAHNFTDLVHRIRYLQWAADHDRRLMAQVDALRTAIQESNQSVGSGLRGNLRLVEMEARELMTLNALQSELRALEARGRTSLRPDLPPQRSPSSRGVAP